MAQIRVRYFCLTISHFPCTGSCTFVGLWKICSCLFIPILHSEPYDNLYNSSVVLLPWDYPLAAFLLYALKLDCHLHQNFSLERNIQVPVPTLSLLFITRVNVRLYIEINQCTYNFIDREQVQTETDRCEKTLYNTFTFIDCCYGVNQ